MKLQTIAEDRIPKEFKHLAKNYWDIRDSISGMRWIEPGICKAMSQKIQEYFENRGHRIEYVIQKGRDYHFFLIVDDQYIVDGAKYQFYYYKPITAYLPKRISKILIEHDIITIGSTIGLLDYAAGHDIDPETTGEQIPGQDDDTDNDEIYFDGDEEISRNYDNDNLNLDINIYDIVLEKLRTNDIEIIKGRLLPMMLTIEKKPNNQYWGKADHSW